MLAYVLLPLSASMILKCRVHRADKMYRYVAITVFVLVVGMRKVNALPPLRLTIDCGSEEDKDSTLGKSFFKPKISSLFENDRFNVNSFCKLIHSSIPKAIKDGRFILRESDMDQSPFGDTLRPVTVMPPQGFSLPKLPRFRLPKLRVPELNVPRLSSPLGVSRGGSLGPPRVGKSMTFPNFRETVVEDSSAERMEKFKKGVQKMLHVVKVLGQVDQYLSERTRIVVDKLSKTLAD